MNRRKTEETESEEWDASLCSLLFKPPKVCNARRVLSGNPYSCGFGGSVGPASAGLGGGAVPAEWIGLDPAALLEHRAKRPTSYKIGPNNDIKNVGLATDQGKFGDQTLVTCGDRNSGNYNGGHEEEGKGFGTELSDEEKKALLEYFKTLWPGNQCPFKDGSDGTGAVPGWPVRGVMVPGPLRPGRPTNGRFVPGTVPKLPWPGMMTPGVVVVGPVVPAPGVMNPGLKETPPREPPEMILTWPPAKADSASAPLVAMTRSDFLDMAFIMYRVETCGGFRPFKKSDPAVSGFSAK